MDRRTIRAGPSRSDGDPEDDGEGESVVEGQGEEHSCVHSEGHRQADRVMFSSEVVRNSPQSPASKPILLSVPDEDQTNGDESVDSYSSEETYTVREPRRGRRRRTRSRKSVNGSRRPRFPGGRIHHPHDRIASRSSIRKNRSFPSEKKMQKHGLRCFARQLEIILQKDMTILFEKEIGSTNRNDSVSLFSLILEVWVGIPICATIFGISSDCKGCRCQTEMSSLALQTCFHHSVGKRVIEYL